jgi:hypothetical protein
MGNKGYGSIPGTLFECITFLARALPVRSVPTFIELLIGAMLTQNGFVTGAWLAINPLRSWSAYYKWLQEGKWSWVALGVQMARMVVTFFPQPVWFLIFDDTFIYRSSSKAPGSGVYHQHGNKANRPQYARGQCWVSMALSITKGKKHSAVPLLSRLMRTDGNTGKLDAAKTLLRSVARVFAGKQVFSLVDSWYMKWPYLRYVLTLGFDAIGQVRRDTALYSLPVITGKRGRPAKYGDKYTPDAVVALPEVRHWVFLYGKWQWVRYRTAVCLAKFLHGHQVRAVWMQFEDDAGKLSKQRLLLSTRSELRAEEIFKYYARRWSIEDLFNQMKNGWGWREAWQQSRQVLHRWTQILSAAYALPQLLATYCGEQMEQLMRLTPWRKKATVTAGQVRLGLRLFFGNVRVRDWWNPTCRKFQPGSAPTKPGETVPSGKNARRRLSKNNREANSPPPS